MKRIVVKIGTTSLVHPGGRLNIRQVETMVKVLSDMVNAGNEIILVSSGAIAMGVGKLGLASKPEDLPGKQAVAAVGQCELMYVYDKLFSEYNHTVAQILVTAEDLENKARYTSFQNTLFRLLEMHTIPVLNENDTMSTHEITSIGDNDTLAAHVAIAAKANWLILLSDIEGLYDSNPKHNKDAKLLSRVDVIDDKIMALAEGTDSTQGTGGMITKLNAAKCVTEKGIDMIIASSAKPEILYDILEGKPEGTFFKGKAQ